MRRENDIGMADGMDVQIVRSSSGTAEGWLVRRVEARTWTERFLTQYEGTWTLEEVV